jgi:hypothetical protein
MAQDEHLGAVVNAPDLLQVLDRPAAWFFALPPTLSFFVYGLLTAYSIAAGGMVLARSGIKPLWVLLLLVPTLNLVCIWLWALRPWPADKMRGE